MKYLILSIIVSLMITCSPPVVFVSPYPLEATNLLAIPQEYQGLFTCECDSTIIQIGADYIAAISKVEFTTSINEVTHKENCSIINSELYIDEQEECIPITYVNDTTVSGTFLEIDTIWVLSDKSVIRDYIGNLVLSSEIKKDEWGIDILSKDKYQNLSYRAITDESDLSKIKKITPLTELSNSTYKVKRYKINPTKKEFELLFESDDVFTICEYLIKINTESLQKTIIYY